MQALPLQDKVFHTIAKVEQFIDKLGGTEKVYVSYSGGADSEVLLHICRRFCDKNIKAVFCNTGQEWPDTISYVRQTENLDIIRPSHTIQWILGHCGFPLVSKEVSYYIRQLQTLNHDTKTWQVRAGNGKFSCPVKWRYLVNKPYRVSEKCCYYLKKAPFRNYDKKTGRSGMLGIMASESRIRELAYVKNGDCNTYSELRNVSWPMAIWTTHDVWEYIKHNHLSYNPIYDKLKDKRTGCMLCGYGVLSDKRKLTTCKELYPSYYKYITKLCNNGISYGEALHDSGLIL